MDRIDSQLALNKGGDLGSYGWASSNQVKVLRVKPRFPGEEESLPELHAYSEVSELPASAMAFLQTASSLKSLSSYTSCI